MEHLTKKPFFLTDEDILWVGSTLADLSLAQRVNRLLYTHGEAFTFTPVLEMNPHQVRHLINKGEIPYINYDSVDDKNNFMACFDAGLMAVMVNPSNICDFILQHASYNGLIITENLPTNAIALAITTGVDLFLSSGDKEEEINAVMNGFNEGIITEERLREATIQILALEVALGLQH